MKIFFEDGQVAHIELLKNDFVEYWLETMIPLEDAGFRIKTWNEQLFPKKRLNVSGLKHRDKQIDIFNDCAKELKNTFGIEFPGEMYTDQDQKWLNTIHRWVTHGAKTGARWTLPNASLENKIKTKYTNWHDYKWQDDHEPEFEVIGDRDYFSKLLFDMNCAIHEYEEFIISPRAEELESYGFNEKDGYHAIQRYFIKGKSTHSDCYDMANEYRKYCTFEPHDLWLPFAVLGKEYYTTWVNIDNPSEFDITNIDKSWMAGFEWQPNSFTSKVISSRFFGSWLKEHSVPHEEFLIAKLPLGHCTNKKDLDLETSVRQKIINVEF